jgi:hypothetical protein
LPAASGAPAGRFGRRARTWGIAAAAVLLVGAAVGSFAAFGGSSGATPAADVNATQSATSAANAEALGDTASAAPSGSASHSAAPSASAPGSPTAAATSPTTASATAAPPPAPAPTVTVSAAPAPAVTVTSSVSPCGAFPATGASIWRCNGTSWLGISCSSAENNDTGSPFNVYQAVNQCGDRVWLHQDTFHADAKAGWFYCISPGATVNSIPAAYQHPANIQVSPNPAAC